MAGQALWGELHEKFGSEVVTSFLAKCPSGICLCLCDKWNDNWDPLIG